MGLGGGMPGNGFSDVRAVGQEPRREIISIFFDFFLNQKMTDIRIPHRKTSRGDACTISLNSKANPETQTGKPAGKHDNAVDVCALIVLGIDRTYAQVPPQPKKEKRR